MNWFDVDKEGLAKLLERKGKEFILFELLQNAWDEKPTRVVASLYRIPGTRAAELVVEDDSPDGFADLRHAFTLFAESAKKTDATKRGRFNFGEKLVLAICDEATIESTKGGVSFDAAGRHAIRKQRAAGTRFRGVLKLTTEEIEQCVAAVQKLIPPAGIETTFNRKILPAREPLATITRALPTEIADAEGRLRRTVRQTEVEFFEPGADETGTLYELGIPVVETGDRFHANVKQKVPLNLDRDNVTPAYLAQVRALAVETLYKQLSSDDANSWVTDAIENHGDELPEEAIDQVMTLRFGANRVAYDPSDPEANARAAAAGYTVVHGRSLSSAGWDAARRFGSILPAGQVTPSPKPFSPDGSPLKTLPEEEWSSGVRAVVEFAQRIAARLLGVPNLRVSIANDPGWSFAAAYGAGSLVLNYRRLGRAWFAGATAGKLAPVVDLLIHEFAHHYEANHLSEGYYDALSRLGGRLVELALAEPEFFPRQGA